MKSSLLLATTLLGTLALFSLLGQDTLHQPDGNQINGPGEPTSRPGWIQSIQEYKRDPATDREAWLRDLKVWRHEHLIRMGYNDAEYRRPQFQWAQRNFISPQVMVEERTLFDAAHNRWTVDKYLADLKKRYGGIDSVLLWPVYPNIGIDNRNQWDLTRDLPGGVAGLREVVEQFHQHNVRVLLPTMPWDNGTRDPGVPQWTATAKLMAEIGVDGVNGDTFNGLPRAYRIASDETSHPVLFEPELPPTADEGLIWNIESWAYWDFKFPPTASRQKWLESRHMPHICDRWARDKTDDLQNAFFNGIGYVSWENIWGIWNGITERDGEAIRRIATVLRQFGKYVVSPEWEPFSPIIRYGVFASKFPLQGSTFYTLVNRNEFDVAGQQMTLPYAQGMRYYDVWRGSELKAEIVGSTATLSFQIEGHGYGAILATSSPDDVSDLSGYFKSIGEMTKVPLRQFPHEWHFLPQHLAEITPALKSDKAPAGMIKVPTGEFRFAVNGVEIEGFNWEGLDVQYPWEDSPRRGHDHVMQVGAFFIDKYPVTNAQFKQFMDASHYRPPDGHNFLRDWKDGAIPSGWERKPVTWVSLEDARAYAKWAGKRLPHEWEWQYAAQGTDTRLYPWGNHWQASAVPTPDKGRDLTGPANVDAHPTGASPFGVMDLTGNVWQWTDEYIDDHTRAAILRGGSYYQPQGSLWYFPETYKLNEHGKYLLTGPSKDRAGTLGFRCAADAP